MSKIPLRYKSINSLKFKIRHKLRKLPLIKINSKMIRKSKPNTGKRDMKSCIKRDIKLFLILSSKRKSFSKIFSKQSH